MLGLIGIVITLGMVFGGYVAAGGDIHVVLNALPFEMAIILGAACGAYIISNDLKTIKNTISDVIKVFKGPKWNKKDYEDILCILFQMIKIGRSSPVSLEEHIESPEQSEILKSRPKILKDNATIELICDTFRSASMNYDDPHQVEEVLTKRSEIRKSDALKTTGALQAMADGLPALGIVAAVLGVIKTMASIDQPPEVLGAMIGGALVGTFLGVFMSYGFIGPIAARLKNIVQEDEYFYSLIQEVLIANMHRHPANICIEVGRQNIPIEVRPKFQDLEVALRERSSS